MKTELKTKLRSWAIELRAPFLTATLVPIFLGTSIAWVRNTVFNIEYFLFALAGGIFLHLGTNVINDYFDHKSGNDEINKEFVRPFSGGSRTIQLGLLTPLEVLCGALLFYAIGISIGLYLTWTRGLFILFLGLVGVFSGFFYTTPPFNWASKGVGEALVGINFGSLMTLGAYYVQTRKVSIEPFIASIPVSLLIAAVLYINEFPDYNADKAVGKNTLVVRMGREKAAYGYTALIIGVYLSILLGILAGILPPTTLMGFMTLPFAKKASKYVLKYHSSPFDLVSANASTILCHLFTGVLLSVAYFVEWLGVQNLVYAAFVLGVFALLTIYSYSHVNRKRATSLETRGAL